MQIINTNVSSFSYIRDYLLEYPYTLAFSATH